MPFVLEPEYPVLLIILFCFSIGEIPRYLYSFLLVIGKLEPDQTSVLVRLVQKVRWTLFIVVYPLGASLELVINV